MSLELAYEDLPDDAPDLMRFAANPEKYMSDEGIDEEILEEVLKYEDEIVRAANQNIITDPEIGIGAGYKAATGMPTSQVIEDLNFAEAYSKRERNLKNSIDEAIKKMDLWAEKEFVDIPYKIAEKHDLSRAEPEVDNKTFYLHRSNESESATMDELAHSLHRSIEKDREEIAKIYNDLQTLAAKTDGKLSL